MNRWLKGILWTFAGIVVVALLGFVGLFIYANRQTGMSLRQFRLMYFPLAPKEPAPYPTPATTRDERWLQDIDYLARELPRLHVNAFHTISQSVFDAMIATLKANVARLDDVQLTAEIIKIVASVGDGHTSMGRTIFDFQSYPIKVHWFDDDLYVVAAQAYARDVLGFRLLRIGDVAIEDVYERLSVYKAYENEWNKKSNSEMLIPRAALLYTAGILPSAKQGSFTFMDTQGKEISVTLEPIVKAEDWLSVQTNVPLYLEQPDKNFWLKYLEDSGVLFIKYNSCDDKEGFKKLATEALELIDADKVNKLVIDLRGNSGGNSSIFQPLLNGLKARAIGKDPSKLFVMIDRLTYSSAMLNAWELQTQTSATLLGEPTGEKPNSYGEIRHLKLPNSQLEIQYSTRFFQMVKGDPVAIMPDVGIEPTFADFASGRDPVLEYVLAR
jgi:hypothetical protein